MQFRLTAGDTITCPCSDDTPQPTPPPLSHDSIIPASGSADLHVPEHPDSGTDLPSPHDSIIPTSGGTDLHGLTVVSLILA